MAGQSISKGALVLTTDAAQLQSGLSKAQSTIQEFSNRVTGLLGVGLAFPGLSAVFNKIKELGDESENFLNLSEAFEVNVEKLQAWAEAANLAGIETETLVKALRIASEKFPGEADPFASLEKALEQLRNIPDVQERIKAASEIFGGKNAIEVLKIMKADLPGVAADLEKFSLSEKQLKQCDEFADRISLGLTRMKNDFKKFVADSIPQETNNNPRLLGLLEQMDDLRARVVAAAEGSKQEAFWLEQVDRLQKEINKQRGIREPADGIAKQAEAVKKLNEEFLQTDQLRRLDFLNDLVAPLEKIDPIEEFRQQFEGLNNLFEQFQRTPEQYAHALMNLKKALEATGSAAEEVKLPGAAFRGSVEDVSASIRATVGRENTRSAEVVDLLRRIDNKLAGIGVEN